MYRGQILNLRLSYECHITDHNRWTSIMTSDTGNTFIIIINCVYARFVYFNEIKNTMKNFTYLIILNAPERNWTSKNTRSGVPKVLFTNTCVSGYCDDNIKQKFSIRKSSHQATNSKDSGEAWENTRSNEDKRQRNGPGRQRTVRNRDKSVNAKGHRKNSEKIYLESFIKWCE